MSADEVIEKYKKLPRVEQQKVIAFVREAQATGVILQPSDGVVTNEFKHVANEVFSTNAELFGKLAQ